MKAAFIWNVRVTNSWIRTWPLTVTCSNVWTEVNFGYVSHFPTFATLCPTFSRFHIQRITNKLQLNLKWTECDVWGRRAKETETSSAEDRQGREIILCSIPKWIIKHSNLNQMFYQGSECSLRKTECGLWNTTTDNTLLLQFMHSGK